MRRAMFAFGPKRTYAAALHMSAFCGKAELALSGNSRSSSFLEVKRTWLVAAHMSAFDPKRTFPKSLHRFLRCVRLTVEVDRGRETVDVRRREFLAIVGGAAATWPLAIAAQEAGRNYRVAGLFGASTREAPQTVAMFEQVRQAGFIEGQKT